MNNMLRHFPKTIVVYWTQCRQLKNLQKLEIIPFPKIQLKENRNFFGKYNFIYTICIANDRIMCFNRFRNRIENYSTLLFGVKSWKKESIVTNLLAVYCVLYFESKILNSIFRKPHTDLVSLLTHGIGNGN